MVRRQQEWPGVGVGVAETYWANASLNRVATVANNFQDFERRDRWWMVDAQVAFEGKRRTRGETEVKSESQKAEAVDQPRAGSGL